ncbi:Release factor glutamine methyltransferase [Arsenophonus endosymbiont of Aleurodicus dispersus]|uniref:peptide chain release factor N(5)-glutamine methyltransferase n=1 Tax=Arsenophonus endosymbiont of Aleurodicus dispersus TaxID=235559 RepID=UPI000EB4E765|nr:peptide chain release factor N(5)-glutamine methyltransferase [Arsenophonus endosymbiont of Aleurodicus dispersus]VAY02270.1 Release factor glutamine methyltransferase [Arsenophonus endosymbiont of Aleurodicus dispersus]
MNYQHWLAYAANKLCHSDSAKRDAEILLQYITVKTRTFLIAFNETELTTKQQQQLEYLLDRRAKGEPIAYLVEEKEFWSLPIKVSPVTLIPRADTECLVERALQFLSEKQGVKILDFGTGTGAVALALASEYPQAQIVGVDISDAAIELAQLNANNLVMNNVIFCKSNWFTSLPIQQFDMIVSNPPYIDEYDPYLKQGDVRFEPKTALISANHGLADIKLIIEQSCNYLTNNGWLLLEHGWLQGRQVRQLFYYNNYQQVVTFKDYGGNSRITAGKWKCDETHR